LLASVAVEQFAVDETTSASEITSTATTSGTTSSFTSTTSIGLCDPISDDLPDIVVVSVGGRLAFTRRGATSADVENAVRPALAESLRLCEDFFRISVKEVEVPPLDDVGRRLRGGSGLWVVVYELDVPMVRVKGSESNALVVKEDDRRFGREFWRRLAALRTEVALEGSPLDVGRFTEKWEVEEPAYDPNVDPKVIVVDGANRALPTLFLLLLAVRQVL